MTAHKLVPVEPTEAMSIAGANIAPSNDVCLIYKAMLSAAPVDDGVLVEPVADWSFMRSVLEQGASIHQDYLAGRHPTYEHYAARLDEAAREREAALSRSTVLEEAAKIVKRWAYVKEMCYSQEMNERDYVRLMLPEDGSAKSTSEMFEQLVDAAIRAAKGE